MGHDGPMVEDAVGWGHECRQGLVGIDTLDVALDAARAARGEEVTAVL